MKKKIMAALLAGVMLYSSLSADGATEYRAHTEVRGEAGE